MLSRVNTKKNIWIHPVKKYNRFFYTYYLIAKAAFSNFSGTP
jgi:hypothetical protein